MCPGPDDQDRDAVHNDHHQRHHKGHGPIDKQVRPGQIQIRRVKPLFLVLFRAECPDHGKPGQDLPCHQVQPVYQLLHDLKLGHGYRKEQQDHKPDQEDCQPNDPGHGHIGPEYLVDPPCRQDRRIQYHAQQHDHEHLDLLDVVGAPGDERGRGKLVKLIVGKAHHLAEYLSPQIPPGGGSHSGGQKSYQGAGEHAQKRKSDHLRPGPCKISELKLIHVHPQLLIGGFHIGDGRLLQDRFRHIRRLALDLFQHLLHLLWREHSKDIEYIPVLRHHFRRDPCHKLCLDLLRGIASGRKALNKHHRQTQDPGKLVIGFAALLRLLMHALL